MTAPSPLSGRMAARVAGSHPLEGTYVLDRLVSDMASYTSRASGLVTEPPGSPPQMPPPSRSSPG